MLEDKNGAQRTPVSTLGEFGLIERETKNFKIHNKSTLKGVGDDAAMLDAQGRKVLVSTDLLIENVHFDMSFTPLKHLGYKAIIVNLSDIYAMNGIPEQVTVSLALSNRFPVEAVDELYEGIRLACDIYGVDLVGGDTTSSQIGLVISVTVIGYADEKDVIFRDGAQPNDLIVVSGDMGAAFMGLKVLQREKEVWKINPASQPDLEPYQYLIERHLKPEARKDIPPLLKALEVKPTSMMDISDGLSSELMHLCRQSGLGCKIFEDKIPKDPQMILTCDEFKLDSTTIALSGGEEYELVFTMPVAQYDKIKGNPDLTVIGHMSAKGDPSVLVLREGQEIELKAMGWNALKEEQE